MSDDSRQRSLYFLLLSTARKYVLISDNVDGARALVRNLKVQDAGDSWLIETFREDSKIQIEVTKREFLFYPAKSKDSYATEPSKFNEENARNVVEKLFELGGVGYPGLERKGTKESLFSQLMDKVTSPIRLVLLVLGFDLAQRLLNIESKVFGHILVSICVFLPLNILLSKDKRLKKYSLISMALVVVLLARNFLGNFSQAETHDLFIFYMTIIYFLHNLVQTRFALIGRILFGVLVIFQVLQNGLNMMEFSGLSYSLFILNLLCLYTYPAWLRSSVMLIAVLLLLVGLLTIGEPGIRLIVFSIFSISYGTLMTLFGFRESAIRIFLGFGVLSI